MIGLFGGKGEKKVEYIELIYDLIFVYLLGRSNAILHSIENGFFGVGIYANYLVSTLVILQVWYFSTLFINRYGGCGVADYIFLFINMYLMYYMADGTRADWLEYYVRYNIAWGLIMVNLAAQYGRILRCAAVTPWEARHLKYHMTLLFIQCGIIFVSIPVYLATKIPLSWLSLLFGFGLSFITARIDALVPVNTEHLTERVMLFVVFTFGEMIVGLGEYFTGSFGVNTVYFSLMALLIVAGLFLSYGYMYDHVIDRESEHIEIAYMLLHVVLIAALNNITAALEFMREAQVGLLQKNVFIVVSFLIYYMFLFFVGHYSREGCRAGGKFFAGLVGISSIFAAAMALFYHNSWIGIALSCAYVYSMYAMIVLRFRGAGKE